MLFRTYHECHGEKLKQYILIEIFECILVDQTILINYPNGNLLDKLT
jgi:hypothetical protein